MNYLLDTHVFLWLLRDPRQLPIRIQTIAADRSATLLLSIVTPWEMAIKVTVGKLDVADILDDFEAIAARGEYAVVPTTAQQVIRGGRLPLYHRDPFDRLLAAQALDLNVPLMNADEIFDAYGVNRIWQ